MFGSHHNDDQQDDNTQVMSPTSDNSLTGDFSSSSSSSTSSSSDDNPGFDTSSISLPDPDQADSLEGPDASASHDDDGTYGSGSPAGAPVSDDKNDDDDSASSSSAPEPDDMLKSSDTGGGDLIRIKQDALHELTPLVDHLDQTPEEKFRTTMMMIQAADDQSLLPVAFDAAKSISDDKARAQALLDVINEINYFTQQAKN